MQNELTKNLVKKTDKVEIKQKQENVEIETIALPKLKTGVMAAICCLHDDPIP
ncbi:MAG: hypothetical protein HC927_06800 [Deltaproteobacteria bacterium]|nr:hypothetical protein [Deltaproteobacteria bacterium]